MAAFRLEAWLVRRLGLGLEIRGISLGAIKIY